MSAPTPVRRSDRRTDEHLGTRGHGRWAWNLVFDLVRWVARHAHNAYATFGIFVLAGAGIAILFTLAFTELAGRVTSKRTQAFDEGVMRFIAEHQTPLLEGIMLEITALGTGVVVMMIVVIAGMFLWLNKHKHSAILLGVATIGGIALNNLLKSGFGRPRPSIFEWGTHVASSSFPSGHAMSSAVVYGTVAYLAARLQRSHASRILTMSFAVLMIVLICASRMYLGVHYPSDVLAGVTIGLAWAAFCMVVLEVTQLYARRNAPELLASEQPAPAAHEPKGAEAVAEGVSAGVRDSEAERG